MKLIDANAPLDRSLYVASVPNSSALARELAAARPHFALFLAWDSNSAPVVEITKLAEFLIDRGIAYLASWGPGCERVHDIFDEVEVALESKRPQHSVIMTTWHKEESLEEALWFFVNNSFPDHVYEDTCPVGVAATIASEEWSQSVSGYLRDLSTLNKAVGL